MLLHINGKSCQVSTLWEGASLLWFLREQLGLVGTKFGCGVGACGACTVHVDGVARRSCTLQITPALEGIPITTIEGLAGSNSGLHPVQSAWIKASVPQCGYCQAGQIMSASALLDSVLEPSNVEIDNAMSGNLCRCGTYDRIRKAINIVVEDRNNRAQETSL